MIETPELAEAAVKPLIKFYDAVNVEHIPDSATYAALYADGEFAVPHGTNLRRFTHRRWITVTGQNHHPGIGDYEYPNELFTVRGRLQQWAGARYAEYDVPAIVYSDLADMGRAQHAVGTVPVIYWIATRQRGQLSAEELCKILLDEYDVHLLPALVWAHQYEDVNGEYDVSNLFGTWYH
jgi:hypothetical protein